MRGLIGRGYGCDCDRLGHSRRGGQNCGAAEAVSDENLRRRLMISEEIGRRKQVINVRREVGIGKIPGAAT